MRVPGRAHRAYIRFLPILLLSASGTTSPARAEIHNPIATDPSLTQPKDPTDSVARNFGRWDDTESGGATVYDTLEFRDVNYPGNPGAGIGYTYTECAGFAHYHPQHIVRLPNKDGHAYFAVTSSDGTDDPGPSQRLPKGRLTVYKSDAPVDPATDLVPNLPGPDGESVWEDVYDPSWPPAYIGAGENLTEIGWNHPGKMAVIGNLLLVAMEQWNTGTELEFFCGDFAEGTLEDAIFFYDVRDPETPVYWGSLRKSELESTGATIAGSINDVALVEIDGEWILNVQRQWFTTTNVSPDIADWTFVGTGTLSNQHGSTIYSFEEYDPPETPPTPWGGGPVPSPGEKRALYFDGDCDVGPTTVLGNTILEGCKGVDIENGFVAGDEHLKIDNVCFDDAASSSADGVRSVAAADLDGDGDLDVLSASELDDKIAWYENTNGLGVFAPQRVIAADADRAWWVVAEDLDGDGDTDVIASSLADDTLAWYENLDGLGNFGGERLIGGNNARAAAGDLDGDGDQDVLAWVFPFRLVWYENTDGLGSFGPAQELSVEEFSTDAMHIADVDVDGDLDVIASVRFEPSPGVFEDRLAWFENDGAGVFADPPQTISTELMRAASIATADLTGGTDLEVISTDFDGNVAWHVIGPAPTTAQPIGSVGAAGFHVFGYPEVYGALVAADLDGDSDPDLLTAARLADRVGWWEKTSGGFASGHRTITSEVEGPLAADVADIDGDGDLDVLVGSIDDDTAAWYQNEDGLGDFGPRKRITGTPECRLAPQPSTLNVLQNPTVYRGAPNLYSGDKDYDGIGVYVSGGVPIVYAPRIQTKSGNVDIIYQVHHPANQRLTLGQAVEDATVPWTTGGDGEWFAQFEPSWDGEDSAQTSRMPDDGTSSKSAWLETTVNGPGTLTFRWKVDSEAGADFLRFELDGAPVPSAPPISGDPGWLQVTVPVVGAGDHTLRWTYEKNATTSVGLDAAWLDDFVWNYNIPKAVDQPDWLWFVQTNGSSDDLWFGQTTETRDGVDAAQTGDIEFAEWTAIQTTIVGPGTLSYWWKVSSEANEDFLRFELDGVEQWNISGDVPLWERREILIPAGSHTVRWEYEKDLLFAVGEDAGWVDEVSFVSSVVTSAADDGPGSLRHALAGAAAGSTITFDASLDGATITLATELAIADGTTLVIDASSLPSGLTLDGTDLTQLLEVPAAATVTVDGLTFANGNVPAVQLAGAIDNLGTLDVVNSTFTGNVQPIANAASGNLTVTNTTFSGNPATTLGGGALNNAGTATLRHVTITDNAASSGGGIRNFGSLHIENSIVAGNSATTGPDIDNTSGTITSLGANLIGDNSTVTTEFPGLTALVGTAGSPVDPLLAALADNGGGTETHIPLSGSPAIDTSLATGSDPVDDQRGVARPLGNAPEIGAVEVDEVFPWTLADAGPGSLRQAVADVPAGGVITFPAATFDGQTIALASPITISKDLTLDASELPNALTLNGGGATRIFDVLGNSNTVFLRGFNIRDGLVSGEGGGIYSTANLTLEDCTLSNNTADFGGGIFSATGAALHVERCVLFENDATVSGAAINARSDATLVNTTLAANDATFGGGVFIQTETLTLVHSTVATNTATTAGGGVFVQSATLDVENSIVAGNTGPAPGSGPDINNLGTVTRAGANLIGDNDTVTVEFPLGAPNANGDLVGVAAQLDALGDYGGPTLAMAPLPASPVVEAAVAAGTAVSDDQRGVPRPAGFEADIGAIELLMPFDPSPAPGEIDVGGLPVLSWSGPAGVVYEVFFDSGGGLTSLGQTSNTEWVLASSLALDTAYQWRVDTTVGAETYTGAVWSFTTRTALVTTPLDEDDGGIGLGAGDSLREIIASSSDGDTVVFDPTLGAQTIALAGTPLVVDKNLVIDATALSGGLVIDAGSASRIFDIDVGIGGIDTELRGMTLTNGSADSGGAVRKRGTGTLRIVDSTISDSHATVRGGGLYTQDGTTWVTRSTLVGNTSDGDGGGAYFDSTGLLVNSTATQNTAVDHGGGVAVGDGLFLANATIVGNSAGASGGGVTADGGSVQTANSIIAGNSGPAPGAGMDLATRLGGVILNSANPDLIGDNDSVETEFPAGAPNANGDFVGVAPQLSALGDYGGFTHTMVPLPGSPAIGQGDEILSDGVDQRGISRPQGVVDDIGAVEVVVTVDTDGDGLDDSFETTILGTDPNLADSDGDGVEDGDEFVDRSDPLDAADWAYTIVDFISYSFDGDLQADQPNAPPLVEVDPMTQAGYAAANVFGEGRIVYSFGGDASPPTSQGGLQLDTSHRITGTPYTVEMIFELDGGDGTLRRVLDAKDRLSQVGAYIDTLDRFSGFPSPVNPGPTVWLTNTYQRLVIVKEANGDASLYHDGVLVAQGPEGGALAIDGTDELLSFFLDNLNGGDGAEYQSGSIAFLRIWNRALTAGEVAALTLPPQGGTVVSVPALSGWGLGLLAGTLLAVGEAFTRRMRGRARRG